MLRIGFVSLVAAGLWAQTGSVSGIVLSDPGNKPVARVHVSALLASNPQRYAVVESDSNGRFRIDGLPAGKYQLVAHRENYEQGGLGSQRITQVDQLLALAAGEQRTDVVLRVTELGSISGTVYDADGDPAVGAQVQALVEVYPRGTRELMMRSGGMTDDRGQYHLYGLRAGSAYYISARQANNLMPNYGNEAVHEVFLPVFYPGVVDPGRARPLTLAAGQKVSGIDIRLISGRGVQLKGRIAGVPAGENANQYVSVRLVPVEGGPSDVLFGGAGPPEYQFVVPSVPPGRYRVYAELQSPDRHMRAQQVIDISEGMQDEVTVSLSPGVTVGGKVRYEGTPMPAKVTVQLVPGDSQLNAGPMSAQADDKGSYAIPGVPPGIWDINVTPVPKGGFIKSMTLGKQDVLTEEMMITDSTADALDIVVSANGAKLEGTVESTRPAGNKRAIVLVAPSGKFEPVFSFYSAQPTDTEGRFRFDGLTPGDYKVYAFDEMTESSWLNAAYLKQFEGVAVKLEEGLTVKAAPHLIETAKPKAANR